MTNNEFADWFKKRTKQFAIDVIKFLEQVSNTHAIRVIRFQLIKSVTSVAANYRAVCRARSNNEFYAKICIVVEEADETVFWLEMIQSLNLGNQKRLNYLLKEGNEILAIVASSKKKAGIRKG